MLCDGGKVGLACFFIGTTTILPLVAGYFIPGINSWLGSVIVLGGHMFLHIQAVNFSLAADPFLRQLGVRAAFLGTVFSAGVHVAVIGPSSLTAFGWYVSLLSFFHFSEFLAIAAWSPKTLGVASFILDHSPAYKIALVSSWIEFFTEWYFWPCVKSLLWLSAVGLVFALLGEAMRKTAMYTAAASFTHLIADEKTEDHRLVTHGLYAWCRHPSYVGWFIWSVSTQVVLCNPLCLVGYALASWKFFADRIEMEEITLLNMYQLDYVEYQRRVPTGIPFIRGHRIDE